MSDNLPLEIQEEIMKRLPVKSLIQFRSVSKAWKSLIGSSRFIAQYSALHTEPQHLLVVDDGNDIEEDTYATIVDDDSFPQLRDSLTPPSLVNMVAFRGIIGSSHGLFCLYGYHFGDGSDAFSRDMAVLWNISIRKAVAIGVPNAGNSICRTFLDFGVCPETADPKIVKISQPAKWSNIESETCIPWQVEVFTLSTGTWRSSISNLPRKSIYFGKGRNIDGVIYWLCIDRSTLDVAFRSFNLIISFDMTSEEFREINLPSNFVYHRSRDSLSISSLGKSLVVLEHKNDMNAFVVWMMEGGAPNSFTKLYTISAPDVTIQGVLGFRKSGEPVIEAVKDPLDLLGESSSLCVYEPNSKHISDLGIVTDGSFSAHSYMETLLLIDQPELAVFDKGKRCIAKWRAKTEGA